MRICCAGAVWFLVVLKNFLAAGGCVPFLLSREGSGGEGTGDALGCDDWSDAREYREGVLNNEK